MSDSFHQSVSKADNSAKDNTSKYFTRILNQLRALKADQLHSGLSACTDVVDEILDHDCFTDIRGQCGRRFQENFRVWLGPGHILPGSQTGEVLMDFKLIQQFLNMVPAG